MKRALLLVALGSLYGCRAIVGSYEVGNSSEDSGADITPGGDTGLADTTPPADTNVVDTAPPAPTSCKQILAAHPGTASGTQTVGLKSGPATVFCDMTLDGGGYTLVATRASTTDATPWKSGSITKTTSLTDPEADADALLDVDWTEIGFDEVLYDIAGATPTHAHFDMGSPSTIYRGNAKSALSSFAVIDAVDHPACSLEPDTKIYPKCLPPPPPPDMPNDSIGWLY